MTTIDTAGLRQLFGASDDARLAGFISALLASPALDMIAAQIGSATGLPVSDFGELLDQDGLALTPVLPEGDDAAYGLDLGLPQAWRMDLAGFGLGGLGMALRYTPATDDASAGVGGTLSGSMRLGSSEVPVSCAIAGGADATTLELAIAQLQLGALIAEAMGEPLPEEVPDFTLEQITFSVAPAAGSFSMGAMATSAWELPIGVSGIVIREVAVALSRAADETGAMAVAGAISGTLGLGPASVSVAYSFPGELRIGGELPALGLSPLVQALCGSELVRELPLPASVLAVELTGLSATILPQSRTVAFAGSSALGTAEVVVARTSTNTWGFNVGFAPPASWRFSAIDDSLAVLDGLRLDGTTLIISSADDRTLELATIALPREDVAVIRGLNFFGSLDVSAMGVQEIIGLTSLNVYAAIGTNPADLVLEARVGGRFELGNGVAFGDITFRLQPSPTNFAVTLLGTVHAMIDQSTLAFIGGMRVTPTSAVLQATMEGMWVEPFGTRNIAVGNLALDLGLTWAPLLPTVGLAGELQVGSFTGMAAVKFDAGTPSKSMLAVAFNRLFLMDLVRTFCGPTVTGAIPQRAVDTVLNIGFEDVEVYIVPQQTQIGEIVFEQGLRAKGRMFLWGLQAEAALKADYLEGIELSASVQPLDIAGIFRLTGARGHTHASAYLKVAPTSPPVVDINGAVELLGLRSETIIKLSEDGFYFLSEGRVFDLFMASVEARGRSLSDGADIWVRATMQNDLLAYLRDEASKAIRGAADDATRKLSSAQASVKSAEAEVNRINAEIERQRGIIRAERERDAGRLREAQERVRGAEAEVNRIKGEIDRQRGIIRAERERDAGRLREAQAQVNGAQAEVNRLQGEIDSTKRRIDQLNADIAAKKRWYNKLPWYKQSYGWAELSAYSAAKGAEIGGLYTKIGGIEAAKHTAIGVLEGYKQTLRGIEAAAVNTPIDADPRVAGLFAGLKTAEGSLIGAREILRGLELAATNMPIDADPRVAGLFAGRETAHAGLQAANLTLEGVKRAIGPMAGFAEEVARYSLGGLLDVRAASFEGNLAMASGGSVDMSITLQLMSRAPQTLRLAFNFHDPLSAAKALANQLLPA